MPYHDLSITRGLVKKYMDDFKTHAKNLFKPEPPALEPPPPLPHFNDGPPEKWMGWWTCTRCHAWAYPSYNPGPHPCGFLRCSGPNCKSTITRDVETSPALQRIRILKTGMTYLTVNRLTGAHLEQIPYLTVCRCGLTHRARLYQPSLMEHWKDFPRLHANESTLDKFRRFRKRRVDDKSTRIEFKHVQCNKCHSKYDAQRWQIFEIRRDSVFHIDGSDEFGRWAEVRVRE